MRGNPPLKRVRQLGPNMTEAQHGDVTVLYSYETPVAVFAPGHGYLRSMQFFSNTTSRHISKWLDGVTARKVPQATIAHLAEFADEADVQVASAGARNPARRYATGRLTPRDYPHPGKYEGELALVETLDALTSEWGQEYIGGLGEDGPGWAATPVEVDADVLAAVAQHPDVTRGDIAFLRRQRGVILHHSEQGFVSASWYTSKRQFEQAVASLETEAQEFGEGEGD